MVCENPRLMMRDSTNRIIELTKDDKLAYFLYLQERHINKTAKQPWFLKNGYEIIVIPCGQCLLCQTAEYKEWALRCLLEAREYDNNQFITLTYNEENEPVKGVNRAEITRFMHNLREHFRRKKKHTGIRFYASAEYGKKSLRAHYHFLLFNCPSFGDEEYYKKNDYGQALYTSEILKHLWGKGFCTIGAVTRQSCDYVTRFRLKNFYRKLPKHLQHEFHCMSTQKGIGIDYLIKNLDRIIAEDAIHVTGNITAKLPRFYDRKIAEFIGQERFKQEIEIPRAEKAKALLSEEMARTGLSEIDTYWARLEQETTKANQLIKKFTKKGD